MYRHVHRGFSVAHPFSAGVTLSSQPAERDRRKSGRQLHREGADSLTAGSASWSVLASIRDPRLEYFTVTLNRMEALVSIVAGLIAGSVSLIGFGLDSLTEVTSGAVRTSSTQAHVM